MSSTHNQSVNVLAGILPLKLRFHELNCKFIIQCMSTKSPLLSILNELKIINPSCHLLSSYNDCSSFNISSASNYFSFDLDVHTFKPSIDFSLIDEINFCRPFHNGIIKMLVDNKISNVLKHNIFHTDGSLFNNNYGFGIYNSRISYFYRLSQPCSVYVAELSAIYFSICCIHKLSPAIYYICTDSLSSLLAINSFHFNNKSHYFLFFIKKMLLDLHSQGFIIKLLWIPSHCDIFGNEQADRLAKLGSKIGVHFERIIQMFEYFPQLNRNSSSEWQNLWSIDLMGRWCHSIIPIVKNKSWFHDLNMNRNFIKTFSRIMSNHYCLKSHLFRINIIDNQMCDCNQSYEDIDHILFHCNKFNDYRERIFNSSSLLQKKIIISIRDAVGTRNIFLMKLFYNFLLDNSIKL